MEVEILRLRKRVALLERAQQFKSHKCPDCKFSTNVMSQLDRHLYDKHRRCHRDDGYPIKLFGCTRCDISESSRRENIELHFAYNHLEEDFSVFDTSSGYIKYVRSLKINVVRDVTRPAGQQYVCLTDKPRLSSWPSKPYVVDKKKNANYHH
jgi:hypothetical protein